LGQPLFEAILLFRQKVRKGFNIPLPDLCRELDLIFDQMDADVRSDPRLNRIYTERARYFLAGFTDDVITNSEWAFAYDWRNHLVEKKLFGTAVAGERIPEIIDQVTGAPDECGLAELVFTCLALGYRGRYQEGSEELEMLRRRLYRFLPNRVSDEERRVVPQAYEHTVPCVSRRLRPLQRFLRAAILTGFLFALVLIFFLAQGKSHRDDLTETLKLMTDGYVEEQSEEEAG